MLCHLLRPREWDWWLHKMTGLSANKPLLVGKGRLLIAPRAGLTTGEFENALKPHNGKSRIHLKKINTHIVELPEGADEVVVMRELKKDPRLKYVELDWQLAMPHP